MHKENTSSKEDNIFQDYYDLISAAILRGEDERVDLKNLKTQLVIIEQNLEKYLFNKDFFGSLIFTSYCTWV